MPASPWSVKGVDADARAAAKLAARRAGLTLGAWLNQTIRSVAGAQLRLHGTGAISDNPHFEEAAEAEAIVPAAPAVRPGRPAANESPAANAADLRAIYETLQELSHRMEATEARTTGLVEPLVSQVRDLRQQLSDTRGRPGITTAPFERALHRIAERLERLEGGGPTPEEALPRLREGRG